MSTILSPAAGSAVRMIRDVVAAWRNNEPVQNAIVDDFTRTYGADSKARIPGFGVVHVLTSRSAVQHVLQANTSLGYANAALNRTLDHGFSINCVDAGKLAAPDKLWLTLHKGVKEAFSSHHGDLIALMEEHKGWLVSETLSINKAIDAFGAAVWAPFCYGQGATQAEKTFVTRQFCIVRRRLGMYLRQAFHANVRNALPAILGWQRGFGAANDPNPRRARQAMDALLDFSKTHPESAAARYRAYIAKHYFADNPAPEHFQSWLRQQTADVRALPDEEQRALWVDRVARENLELSVLALDFITLALVEKVVVKPEADLHTVLRTGFLFPIRFRQAEEDIPAIGVRQSDYCLIDIIAAGFYFSNGMRSCPGQSLVRPLFKKFEELAAQAGLRIPEPDRNPKRGPNVNIPILAKAYKRNGESTDMAY